MKLIVQSLQKMKWSKLNLENDLESRGLLNAEIEVEKFTPIECVCALGSTGMKRR